MLVRDKEEKKTLIPIFSRTREKGIAEPPSFPVFRLLERVG